MRVTSLDPDSGSLFDFYERMQPLLKQIASSPSEGADAPSPVQWALNEALVNALIHADYLAGQGLTIDRIQGWLVVSNPGGLRMSRDEAAGGQAADPRNAVLTSLFTLVGAGRGTGQGLSQPYAIWKTKGLSEPVLRESFNPDRTILSLTLPFGQDVPTAGLGKDKRRLLDYLTDHEEADVPQLAQALSLSPAQVKKACRTF